jgi:hypothetical protein
MTLRIALMLTLSLSLLSGCSEMPVGQPTEGESAINGESDPRPANEDGQAVTEEPADERRAANERTPAGEEAPVSEPRSTPEEECSPGSASLLAELSPYAREPYFKVHVDEDVAYVSSGLGLEIFDVSDPTSPTPLSWLETTAPFGGRGLQVVDGIAYIANLNAGLWLVDVSDPTAPVSLSAVDFGLTPDLEIEGDLAWFASGTQGLVTYDVSDATAPVQVSAIDTGGYALAVDLVDDYAYVACETNPGHGGLHIIDIGEPANPVQVGAYGLDTTTHDVQVQDDLAYLATESGFEVVDVSDPANPHLISALDLPSVTVELDGDVAWVTTWTPNVLAIDISDPTAMTLIAAVWDDHAYGLAAAGGNLFVAGGLSGLLVLDVTDPGAPQHLGSYEAAIGIASDVAFEGDRVWVVTHSGALHHGSRLHGYDVSDPTAPRLIGTGVYEGKFGDLTLSDGVAYATTHEAVTRWDVTGEGDPTLLEARIVGQNSDRIQGSSVHNGLLYVVKRRGLVILTADTLTDVGGLDIFEAKRLYQDGSPTATHAEVAGLSPAQFTDDLAFIGTAGGIVTVDIADPAAPIQLNVPIIQDYVPSPAVTHFTWLDHQTLLSGRGDLFDISTAWAPVLVSETGVTWSALESVDGWLFHADTSISIFPLHPESSAAPEEPIVQSADWQIRAEAIAVQGDLVVTAGGHTPLRIHRVDCATAQ